MTVAALLLAAGGSTRLGSPKQLLKYRGQSLLRHAARTALAAGCQPVLVILGSSADRLKTEIADLDAQVVENPRWANGMGTSVRLGMETLEALAPAADGVMLMLCDQPLVGPEALERLLETFRRGGSPDSLAAAAYDGTVGVPAVFGRAYFDELRALPEDAGAKSVLRRHRASVIAVALPEAATDIDTREQYESLVAAAKC